MVKRFLIAAVLLLATLAAPAALSGKHHLSADGFYPPVEATAQHH